jgi:hypothetical protein
MVSISPVGSRKVAPWAHASALVALLVAVAAGLAGAFVVVAPSAPNTASGARLARFTALVRSLNLEAEQKARADALFTDARRKADANPSADARRVAYRKLIRQAMTTLRQSLNIDQRAVLDRARAREAAAESGRERAERVRLDQLVESLALNAEQQAIAAPLIAQATYATDSADFDKADVLEAGYGRAFRALRSTLTADQKAKLDAALEARITQATR